MKDMDVAAVSFRVGKTTYDLEPPTAGIAFRVARSLGGFARILPRCQDADPDAWFAILRAACPAAPQGEADLQQFIFDNVPALFQPLAYYAWSLENGGKPHPDLALPPPEAEAAEDAEADPPKPAKAKKG